jgi:hypothetical protein
VFLAMHIKPPAMRWGDWRFDGGVSCRLSLTSTGISERFYLLTVHWRCSYHQDFTSAEKL